MTGSKEWNDGVEYGLASGFSLGAEYARQVIQGLITPEELYSKLTELKKAHVQTMRR